MHRHNKPYRPVASWVRTARATHAISIHYTRSMPDESHRTPMTSPTSQAPVPSAPARTTSRFRKPSVALSWIRGIVFFLDIPPVLFRGWCAFVGSENNAPDNPPDCAPISPCPATPIQRHREITIASCSLGLWLLCVVLPRLHYRPLRRRISRNLVCPPPSAHLLDRRLRALCLLHSLRPHLDVLARLHHHAGPLLRF